jgi:hypothetical protein
MRMLEVLVITTACLHGDARKPINFEAILASN